MKHLAFLLLTLLAVPAHAEEGFRRSVSVTAEGKVQAAYDRAVLPVTVETRDKSLEAAKKANDARMAKLLVVAAKFSIPKEKIKTMHFAIAPQYRFESKTNKQLFDAYLVSRTLELTVEPVDRAEALIEALTQAGIDQMQQLHFILADPEALEGQARKAAMEKARVKAQQLADAGGAKLGKVLSISLSGAAYAPYAMAAPAPMMKMAAGAEPPPVLPGEAEIEQNVSVTYELE